MYLSSSAPRVAPAFPRVIGDIGGTNVRFAVQLAANAGFTDIRRLECAEFETFEAALRRYLKDLPADIGIRSGAFGIANPVNGANVQMTNHPWAFNIDEVRANLGLEALMFLNDFTALALGLTSLQDEELEPLGPRTPTRHPLTQSDAIGLIGPGTGLGVSGLVFCPTAQNGHRIALAGEGGHVTLAAQNRGEFDLIDLIARDYGHVSAERVLSGNGLVLLYKAMAERDGIKSESLTNAASVLARAKGQDPLAMACVRQFSAFLGSVAGDLALTLGARGGVFIGGGICPRLDRELFVPAFRERFEAKGRFSAYLATIPSWLILDSVMPALRGASSALDLARER